LHLGVPDVALEATVATTCVSLQLTGVPKVLPSHTVPEPCVDPNPEPEMVTCVPAAPDVGDTPVTMGGTVKFHPVGGHACNRHHQIADGAPLRTLTVMLPSLQLLAVPALVPLS